MDRRVFLESVAGAAMAGAGSLAGSAVAGDKGAQLRQHARKLHRDSIVIVIHDHNPVAQDIDKMLAGGVTCKVFQTGVDVDIGRDYVASGKQREGWSRRSLAAIDEVEQLVKTDPRLVIVRTAGEIEKAKHDGKVAVMLGVEGAKLLDGKVEMVQKFYDRGLRELQLRWGVPNQIVEEQDLTPFGRDVVRECERLGVIIGLTHMPTPAFHQVIDMIQNPPIVCHGAAAKAPERRGDHLGDRQLKALASRRGVLGIHFYSSYLGPRPNVDRVVEQVDYIAQVAGIDTVALGVDFFPSDGAWGEFQRAQETFREISWAVPDLSQLERVTEALVANNLPDGDIKKVLGGNFLRVCREVFGS